MRITQSNLIAKILAKAKAQSSAVSWADLLHKPNIPEDVSDLTDETSLLGGSASSNVDGGSANSTFGGARNINGGDVNG
jgi:hypothetical protein